MYKTLIFILFPIISFSQGFKTVKDTNALKQKIERKFSFLIRSYKSKPIIKLNFYKLNI